MVKHVLLIAYHFPPICGSSGMQRTLAFSRFLSDYGWEPIILSVHPRAYGQTGADLLGLLPKGLKIYRAQAWDTARHLAWNGRYLDGMALPDRWISWLPDGVLTGLQLLRKYRPQAIWSTYPVATAHLIGWMLKKFTGTPWIADFRDPMVERNSRTGEMAPSNSSLRKARLFVEKHCISNADRLTFCTKGAKEICAKRYPSIADETYRIIPNGYDEESFQRAEQLPALKSSSGGPLTLLHSGLLYPTPDRDPTAFFEAVRQLKEAGTLSAGKLCIRLRATGHDELYRPILERLDITDLVDLAPPLPYDEALAEMLMADGLLLFQGYTSNPAIPAKLYEYLRAAKPIIAMADAAGETAALLRKQNTGYIFPMDDSVSISGGLSQFLDDLTSRRIVLPERSSIAQFDRQKETALLANILNEL